MLTIFNTQKYFDLNIKPITFIDFEFFLDSFSNFMELQITMKFVKTDTVSFVMTHILVKLHSNVWRNCDDRLSPKYHVNLGFFFILHIG